MSYQYRILFVDNVEAVLTEAARYLKDHLRYPCQIITHTINARNKSSVIEEILTLANETYVHIAILDLRQVNDKNPLDLSGLDAATKLHHPLSRVIYTGYETHALKAINQTIRQIVEVNPTAQGIRTVSKTDEESNEPGFDMLLRTVHEEIELLHLNLKLHIEYEARLKRDIIDQALPNASQSIRQDAQLELDDLFRSYFYNTHDPFTRVDILPCPGLTDQNYLNYIWVIVQAQRQSGDMVRYLTIIGMREAVEEEHTRALQAPLSQMFHVAPKDEMVKGQSLQRLAMRPYRLIDDRNDPLITLGQYYDDYEEEDFGKLVTSLYGHLLRFQKIEDQQPIPESAVSEVTLNSAIEFIHKQQQKLKSKQNVFDIKADYVIWQDQTLPNPGRFASKLLTQLSKPVRLTHGGIKGNTVLIAPLTQRLYVPNYSALAPRAAAYDFVTLESDLRLHWLEIFSPEELMMLDINPATSTQDPSGRVKRALKTLEAIRNCVEFAPEDHQAYWRELLRWWVNDLVTCPNPAEKSLTLRELKRYVYGLRIAAQLCTMLTPIPVNGYGLLWYEEGRNIFWGKGSILELPPTAHKILKTLYERQGETVPYKTIWEKAWSETEEKTPGERAKIVYSSERDLPSMQRQMVDLRDKIEEHFNDQVEIKTVTQQGYRLIIKS